MINTNGVGKLQERHYLPRPRDRLLLHRVGIANVGGYDMIEGKVLPRSLPLLLPGQFLCDAIGLDCNFAAHGVLHRLEVARDGVDREALAPRCHHYVRLCNVFI